MNDKWLDPCLAAVAIVIAAIAVGPLLFVLTVGWTWADAREDPCAQADPPHVKDYLGFVIGWGISATLVWAPLLLARKKRSPTPNRSLKVGLGALALGAGVAFVAMVLHQLIPPCIIF